MIAIRQLNGKYSDELAAILSAHKDEGTTSVGYRIKSNMWGNDRINRLLDGDML